MNASPAEVERFVERAIVERAASVLLAGPPEPGSRRLRTWAEALGAERLHGIGLVADPARAWEGFAPRAALLRLVVCGGELTPEQAARSALRQDPDLLLFDAGACPPLEMVLTCALTGHQVLGHAGAGLAGLDGAMPFGIGAGIHLGVEADEAGIARLVEFSQEPGGPLTTLWDRAAPGPLPLELPGRAPPPPPPPPPDGEEAVARVRAGLAAHLRAAWLPVLDEPGEGPGSRLGGRPLLAPGEPWPGCPSCARPMPLALQLGREGLPDEAAAAFAPGAEWLQLFSCVDPGCPCEWPEGASARNRLLRWLAGPCAPASEAALPEGRGDPAELAGWEERSEAPDRGDGPEPAPEDRPAWERVRAARGDKLLGWPRWGEGPDWPGCPRCGERMSLLFQLDAGRGRLRGLFAADGLGHVMSCRAHPDELRFAWARERT